jgi:GTP-binding protein
MPVVEPVNIVSARFECSALDLEGCPDEILPEFAFIGRSNVGKSSLVNFLTGSTDLAKVSAKPGSTKTLNFFELNRRWRLVDLPGYGYAHVARKDSKKFNKSVMEYLRDRPNLCCVFALVDSSLPPQALDLEFVEWLAANEVPFVLVFTKSDAANPGTFQANIQDFQSRISSWCDGLPDTLVCSARKLSGRTALLKVIDEALKSVTEGVASESPSEETPKDRKSLPAAPRRRPDRDSARPW